MNVLLVYTHPNPSSFNHAIYQTARKTLEAAGHTVNCRELYDGAFKAGLDVVAYETFYAVPYVDAAARAAMLATVRARLDGLSSSRRASA